MNGCETLENLWCNWDKCKKLIPPTRGIYRIVAPIEMTISFSPEINGHPIADAYDVSVLENKYEKANHPHLLYIGKAEGEKGLRQRIRQYLLYGFAKGNSHRGGRAIFQIKAFKNLICEWEEFEDCAAIEHQQLKAFSEEYAVYPIANWRS